MERRKPFGRARGTARFVPSRIGEAWSDESARLCSESTELEAAFLGPGAVNKAIVAGAKIRATDRIDAALAKGAGMVSPQGSVT